VISDPALLVCAVSVVESFATLRSVEARSLVDLPRDVTIAIAEYERSRSTAVTSGKISILLEVTTTARVTRMESAPETPAEIVDLIWDLGHRIHDKLIRAAGPITAAARSSTQSGPEIIYLSTREQQVLTGIGAGLTRLQIAHKLGISIYTVDTYTERIKQKTRAVTLADLVRVSMGLGDA